jgi:hypothetical protein
MTKFVNVKHTTLLVLLLVALIAVMSGCGGSGGSDSDDASDAGIEGVWKLISVEAGGVKVGEDQLGAYDYNFEFKADSKASVSVMGQSYDTTYTFENDKVTFGDDALTALSLVKDGNKLTLDQDGSVMEFEKQ